MTFNLDINNRVYKDLDDAVEYHSERKAMSVLIAFDEAMNMLEENPFFAVRYKSIRCLPLGKKLPYMVHFTIDESAKTVHVHALINTGKDPVTNWIK
jgi:toxin ParE1/3/4